LSRANLNKLRAAAFFLLGTIAPSLLWAKAVLPTNVTVLTRQDLVAHNFSFLSDAIDGLAGINIEREGGRGTRAVAKIRGASSADRVAVLMDGLAMPQEVNGAVDLSQIPVSLIERVEITRGASPVNYGADAPAGVINVVTARPDKKGLITDLGTNVGRYGYKDLFGRFRGRSYLGDATYVASRHEISGFMDNEDLRAESHFGNLTRSFNGKGYAGVEYFFQKSKVGVGNGTTVPFDDWNGHVEQVSATPSPERAQETQHVKLLLASPLFAGGTWYANVQHAWRIYELKDFPDGPAIRDEDDTLTNLNLKYTRGGFEAGVDSMQSKRSIFASPKQTSHENGIYLLQRWTGKKWTVSPGVRADDLKEGDTLVSPRLLLMRTPNKHLVFSANASRAFRRQTYDELRTDVKEPEKAWSYDSGFHWTPADSVSIKATGFYSRVSDLIGTAATEENMGAETELYLESGQRHKFLHVALSGNWTYQRSRRQPSSGSAFVPSPMTPNHLATVRFEQILSHDMKITNEYRYQSEQFQLDNHGGIRVRPYYIWNIRYSLRILKADIYTSVDNVTNRRIYDALAGTNLVPQPNRTFWAGFTIRFAQ
jgi:outer membrane receptor protein involved in Fe transport